MINKYHFNLIEITLAIVVISIGVTSIMGLIPIGVKAHRDAVYLNHAADAAGELLNYAGFLIENSQAANPMGAAGIPDEDNKPSADYGYAATGWTEVNESQEGDHFYKYSDEAGVFCIRREHDVKHPETGAVRRTVEEMNATMIIWYTDVEGMCRDSSLAVKSGDLEKVKQLNVEISWPGSRPYAERQTALYSLEVTLP